MMSTQDPPAYLPRGGACVICRTKKIKCDGNRPKCNQCIRFGREAQCEYGDKPAPDVRRTLEGHISYLENRIRELEREKALANPTSRSSRNDTQNMTGTAYPAEPPPAVAHYLLNQFLPHSGKLGCFLDLNRAFNQPQDPCASGALRAAVYLWGAKLSGDANYTQNEHIYLANTLHWIHAAVASTQQHKLVSLHLLQCEVFVINYMFDHGRFLEGQSHYAVLVGLAQTCRLHKLSFPSDPRVPVSSWLLPSVTPTDDMEKIDAWWCIFALEKAWSALLDVPSMLGERRGQESIIDTPWPINFTTINSVNLQQSQTIQRFMYDVRTGATSSPLAMQAQAAVLLDLACETASYQGDPQQTSAMVSTLDQTIEIFKTMLPTISCPASQPLDVAHELLVAHSFAHVAVIRLFKTSVAPSRDAKCFSAAFTIIRLINDANVPHMTYVHPALALVWGTVCEVLVPLLLKLKANPHAAVPPGLPRRDVLERALSHLRNAMCHCARNTPLFASPLQKLNQVLQ